MRTVEATVDGQAARQPDPLPGDGGGGGQSGKQFGKGEIQPDGPPAADGASLRAALPQFWRHFRTAGRAAEPDRRAMTVDVAVRAANLQLTGNARACGSTVPADDRVEVRFPAGRPDGRHGPHADRGGLGQLRRRRHGRAAGLYPGDHRGFCHLRRDR